VLISQDLMRYLAAVVTPPAQLCLARVLGSDIEYVFRVRYGDVFLDYPVRVPLFDSSIEVEKNVNWDETRRMLHTMSQIVLPPEVFQNNQGAWARPLPQTLAPIPQEEFYFAP
jgi:hypothetical protein